MSDTSRRAIRSLDVSHMANTDKMIRVGTCVSRYCTVLEYW